MLRFDYHPKDLIVAGSLESAHGANSWNGCQEKTWLAALESPDSESTGVQTQVQVNEVTYPDYSYASRCQATGTEV